MITKQIESLEYHHKNLQRILRLCEAVGRNFDELDDATIGVLSYRVEGLCGFINVENTTKLYTKLGAGLRKLKNNKNNGDKNMENR